jgi:HAD superfamily hydrolase (TIGR01509 family)
MKTILVDAVDAFVIGTENGFGIFEPMQKVLDAFPNIKIILTGADDEQFKKFGLDKMPYEVFTLKHNPEKINPEYYKKMLEHFKLKSEEVVYFEHNPDAVKSAEAVGIKTHFWDNEKRPLRELAIFLEQNI